MTQRSTTHRFNFYKGKVLLKSESFFGDTREDAKKFAEEYIKKEFRGQKGITIRPAPSRGRAAK